MQDKDLYVIAVMQYKKQHPDIQSLDLFSVEWNVSENYYLKNMILAEAIKKNIRVEDTYLYHEHFEEKIKKGNIFN